MGLDRFGIPEKEVEYLKELLGLKIFVEGGTFLGDTAKKMSKSFRQVYTIEKSDKMFETAEENIGRVDNITMLKGDTREHLGKILDLNDNLLFWLDAHWSGGDTWGKDDVCPLIEELELIFASPNKNKVILIDDARLFTAPPPSPHRHENWPAMKDIVNILPADWDLIIFEDVIYVYKENNKIKKFFQNLVTDRWIKYGKENSPSFVKGLKIMISSLLKGNIK